MKVVQLYNQQRSVFGGEEAVVSTIRRVLEANGHDTRVLMRSSRGIENSIGKRVIAGIAGVFNIEAYRWMQSYLSSERPDILHVHSVYPNFSPSILLASRRRKVATVVHVHSHILTCPNWFHLRNGRICNLCFGGREYNCLLSNCRNSLPESAAYALRSGIANRLNLFRGNATLFLAVSDFVRKRLVQAGYPEDRVEVVANAVPSNLIDISSGAGGNYIGFSGRLSTEKGVDTLLAAAAICGLPVRVAGDGPEMRNLAAVAPPNVSFLGRLEHEELKNFYSNARMLVVPSRCYETFGLSAAEAMIHGKPIIASRIGALPELTGADERGLLVEMDNPQQLADAMKRLWNDNRLCENLGCRAKTWAQRLCNEDVYYSNLVRVYRRALALAN